MVRCFDFGHHRGGIHFINPAPGNPLDPIHYFNRKHHHSNRS
jgi:hypothetical protein